MGCGTQNMPRLTCLRPRVGVLDTRSARPLVSVMQRLGQSKWQQLRRAVFVRARGLCECEVCVSTGAVRMAEEIDHKVPLWAGGSNDLDNLQAMSIECHRRKTDDEAATRQAGDPIQG